MTLSDLASIGSFVSGLAVLISLVFLYFQLRQVNEQVKQNTRHTQATLWQGASDRGVAQILAMADADLCAAYISGNGGAPTADAIKKRQFQLQVFAWYQISFAELFQQANDGLVSDERWKRIRDNLLQFLRAEPGSRRMMFDLMESDGAPNDAYTAFLKQTIAEAEKMESARKNVS